MRVPHRVLLDACPFSVERIPTVNISHTRSAVVAWAQSDDNVRVLLLSGSTVRGDADSLSDLDLELYVRDPEPLLRTTGWYERFGEVLVVEALENPGWMPTRLVYYVGGKLDFAIADAEALQERRTTPFEVLVDKDGRAAAVSYAPATADRVDATDLRTVVHWFWAAAIMCAKGLARDDLWRAHTRLTDVQANLLRLVEWDHKVRYGWSYDTAFAGKNLKQWADPGVLAELQQAFARLDERDMRRALDAAIGLFVRLSHHVESVVTGPAFDHSRPAAEVQRILGSRTGP